MKPVRFSVRISLIFVFMMALSSLQAQFQSALDSIVFAIEALNVPEDLEDEWIEKLEKFEDEQDSPQFQAALDEVSLALTDYLLNGQPEASQPRPGKKKKKKFFKRLEENISNAMSKAKDEMDVGITLELARIAENNDNYGRAIRNYEIVVVELEEQGEYSEAFTIDEHISELYEKLGLDEEAGKQLIKLKTKLKSRGQREDLGEINARIKRLMGEDIVVVEKLPTPVPPVQAQQPFPPPKVNIQTNIRKRFKDIEVKAKEIANAENEVIEIKKRAEAAEKEKDFAASLQYNKALMAMEVQLEEQKREMEEGKVKLVESQMRMLEQKTALEKQQVELEKQAIFKRNSVIGLFLLTALAFSLYLLYSTKQRDHQMLELAYAKLNKAQDKLKAAEGRIKNLLKQQVSGAVATELIEGGGVQKMEQRFVCILFLDIRDFTPFVEKLNPQEIIEYQNNVLGFMIEKVIEKKGIVNMILGDGFMATFGAPISAGNDCLQAYEAACEIMEMVKAKSDSGEIPATRVGIGLHAGLVVAGNVGTKDRKQYSITGNPVIIAARLEQLNKTYKSTLIVSKDVFEQLPDHIEKPSSYDAVSVKGRSQPVEIAKFG